MDYILNRLLRETIRFLEICQSYVLKGKMCIDDYFQLTNIKFDFINMVLEEEKKNFYFDKQLRMRLNRILNNDNYICCFKENVVGN